MARLDQGQAELAADSGASVLTLRGPDRRASPRRAEKRHHDVVRGRAFGRTRVALVEQPMKHALATA